MHWAEQEYKIGSNNADIIDHKFLLSGHSFLPNNSDIGVIEMALRKNNLMYVPPQDFYETIKYCIYIHT